MKFYNLIMKYLNKLSCMLILYSLTLSFITSSKISSYLKIDIVESINLHCKLNNEFYCNPYTIIDFKLSQESRTSKQIECTKNPAFGSSNVFKPEFCKDIVYINFYQFLTPRDNAFLGDAVMEEDLYEKGNIRPGFLGRIIIHLEKLRFGLIDEWFMIETPTDNSRIMFPSCAHLRIYWTSTVCSEPRLDGTYQIKKYFENISPLDKIKFEPKNFIPLCKPDFANVYKSKFSIIESDTPIKKINELQEDFTGRKSKRCTRDPNQDFGFDHPSNLTSIEEALGYKIIKRVTGEDLDYKEFTKDFVKSEPKHLKTYREFFEKECFKNPDLTIERINYLLYIDAQVMQLNTTNPYLSIDERKLDLPFKLSKQRDDTVYKNTLNQFNSVEDVKNLDKMDDESYVKTLNKMVKDIRDMEVENKTDYTIYYNLNKVFMTNQGLVHPKEELFFRVFALYKWNGGHAGYDELKKEFMLRRKNFYCYELIKIMPTNILFQFVEEKCPDNYVCVDPNGMIISSLGKDPRKVFEHELLRNGVDMYSNFHNDPNKNLNNFQNKEYKNQNKNNPPQAKPNKMRFTSISSKIENKNEEKLSKNKEKMNKKEDLDSQLNEIDPIYPEFANDKENKIFNKNSNFLQLDLTIKSKLPGAESDMNSDLLNFQTILRMEAGITIPSKNLPDVQNDSKNLWLNKFDRMYYQRRKRIMLKKEIIINKVYSHIPILGEILAVVNIQIKRPDGENINEAFLEREANLFKKYLLIYDSNLPFVEKAAKVLLNLVLCNTDKNRLRYLFNEMMEGLCFGDDRSIKIFEEIMRTAIIDSLLKENYFTFEDLHAKANLLRTFNKPFCFKVMTKIKFIEKLIILDKLKERLTYIVWNNDTNKKILMKIIEVEDSIPVQLPENKRKFSYDRQREFDNARDVNKNFLQDLKRMEIQDKRKALGFKFKEKDNKNYEDFIDLKYKGEENDYIGNVKDKEGEIIEKEIDNVLKKLDKDLNVKNENDNEEENKPKENNDDNDLINFNFMQRNEEIKKISNKQMDDNSSNRKLLKNKFTSKKKEENFPKENKSKVISDLKEIKEENVLLNENINYPNLSDEEEIFENFFKTLNKTNTKTKKKNYNQKNKNEEKFESIYKENENYFNKTFENSIKNQTNSKNKNLISKETLLLENLSKKFDELKKILTEKISTKNSTLKENEKDLIDNIITKNFSTIFNKMKFKESNEKNTDFNNNNENEIENEDIKNFSKLSLHEYNNPKIYEKHDDLGIKVVSTNQLPDQRKILQSILKDKDTKDIFAGVNKHPGNKLFLPKEIQSTFEIQKKQVKHLTLNKNNPTKNLILKKLFSKKTFNEMMDQNENLQKNKEQNGLLEVLKKIQNKKCALNYLCIELGEIKGPFKSINPKNISLMSNHKENIEIVTKPLLVINNTEIDIPITPWIPNKTEAKNLNLTLNLYENQDCDLKTMGVNTNNIERSFLQIENKIKFSNENKENSNQFINDNYEIKTKFYKKLEYSNEILANDIFKQGINLIILNREKGYKKLYERTFNTNFNPIESDDLACMIRDTDYNKIIILTGIGKWMGAITPKLIKEIKQIGGPDLNKLISNSQMEQNEEDSFINNAFVLIGRRGLCRYNGIFRIKNFDVSKEMKKFFPDLFADPNDIYFENTDLENLYNLKNSQNNLSQGFFHETNLRLTLNLENDERFSYKSPIIYSVNPSQGPILGNQKITIFGKNFGRSVLDIKEILIRGVICKFVEFVSPEMITCFTGNSKIMGAGFGNVVIKLFSGLQSPNETCNMYSYSAKIPQVVMAKRQINSLMNYRNVNENVNGNGNGNVYDDPNLKNYENPNVNSIDNRNLFNDKDNFKSQQNKNYLRNMSFKEIDNGEDLNNFDKNDHNKFPENFENHFNKPLENNRENKNEIDNLVSDNYKNIIENANKILGRYNENSNPNNINTGFRKKRFQNIFSKLNK